MLSFRHARTPVSAFQCVPVCRTESRTCSASAIFAVSREPGSDPDEHPAIGLRRRAELVVSRRWGTARLDFTNDEPIVDEEFDALADGDARSDTVSACPV